MSTVYDGLAEEYDDLIERGRPSHTDEVARLTTVLTGPGPGLCVDVGCGTGAISEALIDAGWTVLGVDIARVEIGMAVADKRLHHGIVGDASRLPLRDGTADLVASTYTHTDVPSWQATLHGIARSLRSGGRVVYVGMHPAFTGPHAERYAGRTILHSGYYRDRRLRYDGPGLTPGGWREQVGVRHWTLGDFLTAFAKAGLTIEQVVEGADGGPRPGGGDMPWLIGIRAMRF